jgi:pimeloyl-ACP methyl ester carboxylesterase
VELVASLPFSALSDDADEVARWWELLAAHDGSWTSPDGPIGQSAAGSEWVRDTDRIARLAEITTPVLVVCFENDLLFPPKAGRETAASIRGGTFVEIRGAAHGGLVTHSDQCRQAIMKFLLA